MAASPHLIFKSLMGIGIAAAGGLTLIGGAALLDGSGDKGETLITAEKPPAEAPAADNNPAPFLASIAEKVVDATRNVKCPPIMASMHLAQRWPQACGEGRPPFDYERRLDGLWTVTTPGNPKVDALTVSISREHHGIGYRNPEAGIVAAGMVRYPGSANYRNTGIRIQRSADGLIKIRFGQFEYCACVSIEYTARPTGNPDVMVGEWIYQDQRGPAVWRRDPPAEIHSVELSKAIRTDKGYVADRYVHGERPGRVERVHRVTCGYGRMRGNCDSFWIIIRGANFGGAHDVWLDPASHLELSKGGWRCANGQFADWGSGWIGCGVTNRPGDGVEGLQLRIIFWDGIAPGKRTLWVDGKPVPFEVVIDGYPDEEEEAGPELVSLRAVSPEGKALKELAEGEPFVLEARYDGPHDAEWVSTRIPDAMKRIDAPLGEEEGAVAAAPEPGRRVTLMRTGKPGIFRSGTLTVATPPGREPSGTGAGR